MKLRELGADILAMISMVTVDPIRNWKRRRQLKKYRSHLTYALVRLEDPLHHGLDQQDRQYKIEAVRWLLSYYEGVLDFVADGPPEIKLKKMLSKPTRDVTLRDHVFAKVFYDWREHHRVEGF